MLTAQFLGKLTEEPAQDVIRQNSDKIAQILNLPQQWKAMGITRRDCLEKTPKANEALQLMGALHPDVLAGILRSPIAPKIKKPK